MSRLSLRLTLYVVMTLFKGASYDVIPTGLELSFI